MNHWLMKSEPDAFSIDDLARLRRAPWDGVRNFKARNFMRDTMRVGDLVLFYHSSVKPPGVAGIARVASPAYPDHTAWDPAGKYFDPRSSAEKPIWQMVDVEFVEKFPRFVDREAMKVEPALEGMMVLRRGMRLSIQPVSAEHFEVIRRMGRGEGAP
jgi:predicted RNA-binding protein with PUA-like domain